jgi:hypothetical protein
MVARKGAIALSIAVANKIEFYNLQKRYSVTNGELYACDIQKQYYHFPMGWKYLIIKHVKIELKYAFTAYVPIKICTRRQCTRKFTPKLSV